MTTVRSAHLAADRVKTADQVAAMVALSALGEDSQKAALNEQAFQDDALRQGRCTESQPKTFQENTTSTP